MPIWMFAAQRCALGGFGYAGQTCISVQRIFAHHSIADLFTTKLLLQVARLKAGDPSDESTVVGPLINTDAVHRVEAWVEEAVVARSACPSRGQTHGLGDGGDRALACHTNDESLLSGSVWTGGDGNSVSTLR